MSNFTRFNQSERGSAGFKLIMVLLGLYLIAHAAYNFIPVAYDGENFKQDMQTAVIQASAAPNASLSSPEAIKSKLRRAAFNNNIPDDALIEVKPFNNVVRARVVYNIPVSLLPFGMYKYNYKFDNTATPTGFLFKDDVRAGQ